MPRALTLALALAAAMNAAALDVQGHRGARGHLPENTLASFARALAIGVSTIELDVALTADGHVVASHDPQLNPDFTRDADGSWLEAPTPLIRRATLAELRRYDVGRLRPDTDYARRFPHQAAVDGARIPTLHEVFGVAALARNDSVRFNIEVKVSPNRPDASAAPEPFAAAVAEAVRSAGMTERVTVQSFDWRVLFALRAIAPEIEIACLTVERGWNDTVQAGSASGVSAWTGGLDVDDYEGSVPRLVAAAGAAIWSPWHGDLDRARVDEAHRLGLRVIPWTVNEIDDIRAMLDLGVDGIISDYPDRVRREAGNRGLALPPPTPIAN